MAVSFFCVGTRSTRRKSTSIFQRYCGGLILLVGGPDLAALFEYTFRTRIPKSSNQYAALFFSIVDDILIGYFSSTSKTTHIRKFYDNKACLDFTIGVKHHFEQCYCGRKFNDEINQSIRRKTADNFVFVT